MSYYRLYNSPVVVRRRTPRAWDIPFSCWCCLPTLYRLLRPRLPVACPCRSCRLTAVAVYAFKIYDGNIYRLIKYCAGRGRLYVADLKIYDKFIYWVYYDVLCQWRPRSIPTDDGRSLVLTWSTVGACIEFWLLILCRWRYNMSAVDTS